MRHIWRYVFVIAVFVACGTTGCSSSGTPGSQTPSAAKASPSASPTAQQELRRYFSDLQPLDKVSKQSDAVGKQLDKSWENDAMSTWGAAVKLYGRELKLDEEATVIIGAVEPPSTLSKAHGGLLKAYKMGTDMDYWIKENIRLRVPYTQWWKQWERRYQAFMTQYRAWRVEVKIQARKLGVPIPAWLFAF